MRAVCVSGSLPTLDRKLSVGRTPLIASLEAQCTVIALRLPRPEWDFLAAPPVSSSSAERSRPLWTDSPWLLGETFRRAFEGGPSLTVGLEEELLLLDPETLLPANEIERVLTRLDGERRFTREFRAAQLELITPPSLAVTDARRELAAARAHVVERTTGEVRIAALGTHPFSTVPVRVTEQERYRRIAAEWPWATARRGLPCGLHVHVAVAGSERALTVYNAARSYLPEIGALAANSPYFEGRDTGLASARLKLIEDLPRTGIPPAFASWDELSEFVAWGARGGVIPDASYLWWDLRLNPKYGTLEFRVADAQTRVPDSGAVAAVCQTLVAALLACYESGQDLPVHETHRIAENRWRALRYGLHGQLVELDTGRPVPTKERIGRLLTKLEPFAEELGCRNELLRAWSLLDQNGADRQRRVAAWNGPRGLLRWLADETEATAGNTPLAERHLERRTDGRRERCGRF